MRLLPAGSRKRSSHTARRLGLLLAMAMRVGLLFTLSLMLTMDEPFVDLTDFGFPKQAWTQAIDEQIAELEASASITHKTEERIYELKGART